MPATPKKATLINVPFAQLFIIFLFLVGITPVMSQDADKPAKKNDAISATNFFNYTKESLARNRGTLLNGPDEELAYYSELLNHIKNSDSATISKLALPDKFLILAVRNRSSISDIWSMDGKKIADFIFSNDLDYNAFIKDFTIGDELFVSSASTKTLQLFKADLLYKQQVIAEKTVVALLNNDVYYMPVGEFRKLFFKTIVAPAITASGQSEDAYLTAMVNQLPAGLKRTPLWNADKSSEYYSSGVLKSMIPYKNGKIHGTVSEYYSSGVLKSVIPYENGKIHGTVTVYTPNGIIKSTVEYTNGEKILKTYKYYDENGKLLP